MKRNSGKKALRVWHRRIGVAIALFLLLITVTGMLINHAHQLGLDHTQVKHKFLLDHYGIGAPLSLQTYTHQQQHLTLADSQVFINEQLVWESAYPLVAAVATEQGWFVASQQQLSWLSPGGQLVDTLDKASGLPTPITRLGQVQQSLLLRTPEGNWLSDEEYLSWTLTNESDQIVWSEPDGNTPEHLVLLTRSQHLNWERVLLDLHSGRLFGSWTIWFWDVIGLLIIAMLLSGLWLWQSKR